ncbi:MAG: hypothetical protein APF82_05285 [Sphingomonadales bacterium BRH_c42]|nr:MAG: hypothetical protein APF82_05285 [Sphingomonadales bacterium BRH_c42]
MNGGDQTPNAKGQPGLAEAALFGLCPQCGNRTLFAGWTRFAETCRACDLDFTRFNVGDGPAAFLTMIVGAVIVGMALWLDFTAHPPFWVHALIWIPVTTGAVVWGLRISKSALLASEYRNNAREAGSKDL